MHALLVVLMSAALVLTTGVGTTSEEGAAPAADNVRSAAAARSAVVAVAGDIACEPGSRVTRTKCRHAATARLARAMRPDRVLVLGDTQYQRGALSAFRKAYHPTWGKLRSRTWPVPGNHEYETKRAAGYFQYFAGRTPGRPGYYRRALAGWQIFFLNTNCSAINCATQARWLDRAMTRNPARCQMLVMHHPRYTSGAHGNSLQSVRFWKIAVRHRADLALAGHDHNYERFVAKDATGHNTATGMQSFVAGAGGKSLTHKKDTRRGSVRFINNTHGVLRLVLRPTSVSWQYYGIDGRGVLDKGSRRCR